jgi:hypothetical protein
MLNPEWIDRPVDTQGCAPCFHAFLKRSMEARHARATATGDLATSQLAS